MVLKTANKTMKLSTPQNQGDVQNKVSDISNDLLLVMLAHGQSETEERHSAEQRSLAASVDGGQEGYQRQRNMLHVFFHTLAPCSFKLLAKSGFFPDSPPLLDATNCMPV